MRQRKMNKQARLQLVRRMVNSVNTQHSYTVIADLAGVSVSQISRDVAEILAGVGEGEGKA